jgi:beta-glucanase (GH16 family)
VTGLVRHARIVRRISRMSRIIRARRGVRLAAVIAGGAALAALAAATTPGTPGAAGTIAGPGPGARARGPAGPQLAVPPVTVSAVPREAASSVGVPRVAAWPSDVPPPPAGWSTVFSDDFDGAAGSAPSSAWKYDTGPGSKFGTGEIETMTSSPRNVYLDGHGDLDITALDQGGAWTSGRIQTTTANVGAPVGGELQVTASIKQPDLAGGLGYWPAFWMLGPGQWPENGEIDIMEDVNARSEVSGTIHCGTDPGGPCHEPNGTGSGLTSCPGCQTVYRTYTMILNRRDPSDESITFYLDGNLYYGVAESQIGTSTWQAAFDHNLSIIFDLAMGGSYPDGACECTAPGGSTTSGGTMSVAYVAAYTTKLSATGPIVGYGGLCVDDRLSSQANLNPVQVYPCNGTAAQQWTVTADSTLRALGKCMDVDHSGIADGTTVDLYYCNGSGAQVFRPQANGSLYNPESGNCLNDPGWSTRPGTQLQIWACTGQANQQWALP